MGCSVQEQYDCLPIIVHVCNILGLMISGFSRAASVLKDHSCLESAVKAAQFVKRHLYNSDTGTLVRNAYRDTNG